MTNVPDRIREFWKDVYVLFDKNFLMDVSKQESWEQYWLDACEIIKKYEEIPSIIDLLSVISEMISKFAAGRKKDGADQ